MENINWDVIRDKKSVRLGRWESRGEVMENHYMEPVCGEILAGHPVYIGSDHYVKNPNGVQAAAYVEYVTGVGYIVSVKTEDTRFHGDCKHILLKPAKRFNKVTAGRIVEGFKGLAAEVLKTKKKEDGLTVPGTVKFIDILAEQEALRKEMWGK